MEGMAEEAKVNLLSLHNDADDGSVVRMIAWTVKWDQILTLQSESNAYVGEALGRLGKVWMYLQRESMEGKAFPLACISKVWSCIVDEVLTQMLNGFAMVRSCSTEGRALMSLDLATFYFGMRDISPSFNVQIAEEKKRQVDDFIKAFYYDREQDVFEWINHHKKDYEPWHIYNLIECGIGASRSQAQRQELFGKIRSIIMK